MQWDNEHAAMLLAAYGGTSFFVTREGKVYARSETQLVECIGEHMYFGDNDAATQAKADAAAASKTATKQ